MKKLSRKKLTEKIKEVTDSKMSTLDKLMNIKCLLDKNFQMNESDYKKLLHPDTFDCF